MDIAALLAGGVKLAQTTFRIDTTLAPGTWQVQPVGGTPRVFVHATDPLNAQHVDVERDRVLPTGSTELRIVVAPDLRDQLREVIESIEAEECRERDERDAERMGEVTEQLEDPKRLTFSGTVKLGDDDGAPHVGDVEVLRAVAEKFGRGEPLVEVYLGAEREPAMTMAGPIEADEGEPGTDVTPGDVPKIEIGGYDLLDKLRELDGRHVELVVREIQRPGPFYIEVDPRIKDETWEIEDLRFSPKPRDDDELTGAKLVELVEANCESIVVSFYSAIAVDRALREYHDLERERRVVLPEIQVAGKGRGAEAPQVNVRINPHFVADIARMGFGLAGMDTAEELAAAKRGLEAHRAGKLIVALDPRTAEDALGRRDDGYLVWSPEPDPRVSRALARELNEAINAMNAKAEGTEPPEAVEPVALYESDDLSVYVNPGFEDGQWMLGEGISPGSKINGGFTTGAALAKLAEGYKKLTVSEFLRPNAEAVLASYGIKVLRHEVGGEKSKPEPNASERVFFLVRDCVKAVEAELREANAELFPFGGSLGFAPPPTSAPLNNAYERLVEAVMWAERHEGKVAERARKLKGPGPDAIRSFSENVALAVALGAQASPIP